MRISSICLYLTILLAGLITNHAVGQNKTGHFKYGLISYEFTTPQDAKDTLSNESLSFLVPDLHTELFYNKSWVVVTMKNTQGILKSMFNRKSKILYRFFDYHKMKTLKIDSIFTIYEQDSKLSAARDTLRQLLGITISKDEVYLINGLKCHKEYYMQEYPEGQTIDEIFVTRFLEVPNLVFNDHMYDLNTGIPLKIIQDFIDLKITWGVVEFLPISRKAEIFNFDPSGFSEEVFDSKSLIYEVIHFIRSFEPNQKSN